jgi:hypothetical protein
MPPVKSGLTQRRGHRRRPSDPPDQPAASPGARAPPPYVRGSRLWCHPRSARTPHPALARRRPHRVGQPGAGVPLSPPAAPSRRHHHHRTRRRSHCHQQLRPTTQRRIARASAEPSPARCPTVPGEHRRACRLVVVRTLPAAATTNKQLGWLPGAVITSTVSERKRVGAERNSFTIGAAIAL